MSTIKEKLEAIKAIFSATPPAGFVAPVVAPVVAPIKADDDAAGAMAAVPVGYPVDGGVPIYTDISDDQIPGLDANDYVFTDENMTTSYPDGTYNITGTDFGFTVSGGQIVSITNPSGSGPGEPIADIDEPVVPATTVVDAAKPMPAPTAPAVTPESMKVMYSKQEDLKKEIEVLKLQLSKQENFSEQVLELVEMMANQPTTSPVTVPESKKEGFLSKKEANLQKMANAMAEAKKLKRIS